MTNSGGLLKTELITLSNGKRLRLARRGSGPSMVFLHGYPENLQVWNCLIPLLSDQFETIAFDWPGMGYSEAWPGGATPQLKAKRLLAILDELGLQQPTIVGMDMGGQPALCYAAMFPERIRRLVVMNSLVFGDEKTSWEIRLLRKFGFNRFILRHLPRLVFRRAERTFLPAGESIDSELRADFWNAFCQPAVRRFVSKMCAGYQGTLEQLPSLYRTIACPTLVLWAEQDKHFPPVQAERLNNTVPNSTRHILPGGTHWMPIDRADELCERISAFDSQSAHPGERQASAW